jgi:hypothetical protein
MAVLNFDLDRRPLAGLYSRILRRELVFLESASLFSLYWSALRREFPFPNFPSRASEDRKPGDRGLFAASLAVALGEAFAGGSTPRTEFCYALDRRMRTYDRDVLPFVSSPTDSLQHAITLAEIVGNDRIQDAQRIVISSEAVAEAADRDYHRLRELGRDVTDFSPEGPLGPLWLRANPSDSVFDALWQLLKPDQWVAPLARLAERFWSSESLSDDNQTWLLNFGLDGIDSRPALIDRWTETAPRLLDASRRGIDIRQAVDCCRIDP